MENLTGRRHICAVDAVLKRRLKTRFLSAAIHPPVSDNYRVLVLRFTVALRDLEAVLHYVTIVAFRFYLLT